MNVRKLALTTAFFAGAALSLVAVAVNAAPQLNTIHVTTETDEYNYNGTGTGTGCSLREAITAANTDDPFGGCPTGNGIDRVQIPPGTYNLAIGGTDGDIMNNQHGDFDVNSDMEIYGAGRGLTFVDGQDLDRIFDIAPGTDTELSSMTVRNGNPGSNPGGGIRSRGADTRLAYLIVEGNNSVDGAIYNGAFHMDMYRMVIQGNSSGLDPGAGAGGISSIGNLLIDQSLIANNEGAFGGGIYARNHAVIINTTISGNKAGYRGGGIEVYNDAFNVLLDLSNVTITGNRANIGAKFNSGGIGGVSNQNNEAVWVRNSIIAGNVDEGFDTVNYQWRAHDCWGSLNSAGYNIIGKNHNCTGVTNGVNNDLVGTEASPKDPVLGALKNNGGFSKTHAPGAASPAIDSGDINGCKDRLGSLLIHDQRGYARPVEGDGVNQGVRCDRGAHEAGSPGLPTPTPKPPSCDTKPAKPTLDIPDNGANTTKRKVNLDWTGAVCTTHYKVMVRQDSTVGPVEFKTNVQTSAAQTDKLRPNHKYYWRVKSCNDVGCRKSPWFEFTVVKP
jgi:CSLREA domain-containing protein